MNQHISPAARAVLVGALVLALGAAVGFAQSSAGLLVSEVQSGGPAEKAGIARGDIILEAGGTAVDTPAALQAAVSAKKPGDTLSMKIRHGDTEKTVNVALGTQAGRTWVGIALADGHGMGLGMGRGMGRGFAAPAPGALVSSVVAGSPAEKAGLKPGDLILSVDGAKLDAQTDLASAIAQKKVGATVTLSVQSTTQGGTPSPARDVKVTLAKHPEKDAPYLGVQYSMGAPWFGRSPMMPGITAGVLVVEVNADGPAAKAGVKSRDIIAKVQGADVNDAQQVVDAVAKHAPGDTVKITIYRPVDGKMTDLTVTLGKNPQDATKAWMGISMSSFDRQLGPRQPGQPRQPRQPSAGPVGPGI